MDTPIECPDGHCVSKVEQCSNERVCGEKEVLCPDNTCAKSWGECLTLDDCPMTTPFKCINGDCKPVPFSNFGLLDGCDASIQCPTYKPYLCADGECVGD